MWRAPRWSANFPAKTGWVGAIGWNTWSYNDWRLLKSGNLIRSGPAGPFRTAVAHRIVNEGVYWLLINVKTGEIANLSSDNSETTNKLLLTYVVCIYFTVIHAFIEWFFAGQLRNVALIKNLQGFSQLACNIVWEKLKHFGNSLNSFRNELDPAEHTKERPWREMNFKELQEYLQENRHEGKFAVVLSPARRSPQTENRYGL